ncbi:MAG: glycosyltransferase family 2 protein [Infirmifilum sp.]
MTLSFLLVLFLALPIYSVLFYYIVILWLAAKFPGHTKRLGLGVKGLQSLDVLIPIREEPVEIVKETLKRNREGFETVECVKKVTLLSDDNQEYFQRLVKDIEPFSKVQIIRRQEPRGGRTGALDDYFTSTDADYILIQDVDGFIDKRSLTSLCESLEGSAAYVIPWKGYSLETTRVAKALIFFTDFGSQLLYKLRFKAGFFVFPLGSGTAYHRETIVGLGGWGDGIIQDDIYMGVKLASKGYIPALLEDGEIYVLVPSRMYSLRKQQSRWAYGTSEVLSRNLKKILGAPIPLHMKLEMIIYMLQPVETLPPFLALTLSPLVAFMDQVSTPLTLQILQVFGVFAPLVALGILYGLLLYKVQPGALSGKFKEYVVNAGRFSAILAVLSPHLSIAALRGLLRLGLKWEVTPKGEKEKKSPKDNTPFWIVLWSTLGIIFSVIYANMYSLTVPLLYLIASLYSLFRLEL